MLLLTGQVLAQVNVEPLRKYLPERGSTFVLRSSLGATEGNSRSIQVGVAALFGLSDSVNLFYAMTAADYASYNGMLAASRGFLHTQYDRKLAERIWGELYAESETDHFRRMTARHLLGTGPRFQLLEGKVVLYYGASYMLELTQRSEEVASAQRRHLNHRFNNCATITYQPQENVILSETVYYQPRFDAPQDFWLLSAFAARFIVTTVLSSNVDFMVRHESRPPQGVKNTDLQVTNSLALTF